MSWKSYLKVLAGTFLGVNAALYLFVLAMNPFGNLPGLVLGEHKIMDTNQRYQYPWIARSGRYDSLIAGTSISRLFEPKAFEGMLGGRFANVAMDAATAWEQVQMINLFLRHQKTPRTLFLGIDHVWCNEAADIYRTTTIRGFPDWLWDDNRWNDLAYMYNTRSIEIAGRRLAAAVSGKKPRLAEDGYEVFTPPESAWEREKVLVKIYGTKAKDHLVPLNPPDTTTAEERARWRFPALAWLEQVLDSGRWQRIVLAWPPVHIVGMERAGTMASLKEDECKRRVTEITAKRGVPVLDFRYPSDITRKDENFWDYLHFRVPIAQRVQRGLAAGLASGKDDPAGDFKVLTAGRASGKVPVQ